MRPLFFYAQKEGDSHDKIFRPRYPPSQFGAHDDERPRFPASRRWDKLQQLPLKPEDVDCQYCLHYRRKSCQIPICPYIAERLASGALEYHDLVLECLGRHLRLRLYQRIRSVTHWDGPNQAILHKIRPYCQRAADKPKEDTPSVYWAALYLLASRESLWKTAVPALASGYIDFHCISCRGLAVRDYPIFYSAKRLYERKFPMDAGELASRSLIDDQDFLNILYATLIARYGKSVMDTEEKT